MNAHTQTPTPSSQPRHSGGGRNPVTQSHSREAGMPSSVQAGHNRYALNTPASPSWIPAFAGRLRASMPSRRIPDILSINDDGGRNALRGRHAKAPTFRLTPITALIQATLLGLPVSAMAGPEGGVVTAGTGAIARPDAQTTNIHQSSQHLILNWDSYNIRASETVNYRQPNANAQALNRIHSQSPSHIYGRLNANGQVLLVNPNGVFFKPGARVNVGGLIASGLNITDKDFLAGKYRFKHAGKTPPGAVINQGVIQAATGGSVSLIGGAVRNEGQILAHAGQVNLVAGRALAMDFDGDGLMRFTVSEALLNKTEGLKHAVSNTGRIEGGAVLLQGRAARAVFSEVVNNSGVIGAAKVDNTGGVIRLVAGGGSAGSPTAGSTGSPTGGNSLINTGTLRAAGGRIELKAEGRVEVSGKARISTASKTGRGGQINITGHQVRIAGQARLDASSAAPARVAGKAGGAVKLKAQNKAVVTGQARLSATSKTGKGGQIEITGEKVGLMGLAQLDVSGAMGGGQILAGGDYQGKNPAVRNAKVTYVGKNVKLAADATRSGQGGRVIVWADDTTRYHGRISARGGALGGDGGFVEVSGKRHLAFRGEVDVKARRGRAGTLLLDPNDLCIGGNTSCTTGDNTATEDTNNPFDAASSTANSWVSQATLSALGNVNIILQADNNIYFDGNITMPDTFNRDFRLLAGGNIDMRGHRLTLRNGTARFYAGSTVVEKSGEVTSTRTRSGSITLGPVTARTLYLSAGNVNAEGALSVTNLHLNYDRPARTGATGIFARPRRYTGQYTITAGGALNAITNLYVGGTLGDKLHLITLEGFRIASPIKTGKNTILTFEMRGHPHDDDHDEDDELTITQAEGAVISGPGKLVKGGTGTLELSQANTYSGDTEVSGGTLRITHADGLGTPANGKDGKIPASKTTLTGSGSALELAGGAGQLAINASESLILNGGALRNESGANTWHGPVMLGKSSTIDSEAGALTIKSALSLQSGKAPAPKAEDLQITGAGDVRLTGVISGKGGIIKGRTGAAGAGDTGTLTLSSNNTYTGRTIVHRGVLRIQHNNALGTGRGSLGTTVNANGALELYATGTASLNIGNEALTLAGGTLRNRYGDNTWSGNITLTGDATIDSRTRVVKLTRAGIEREIHYQQTLTLAGNISGARDLAFTGAGHTDMRGRIQTGAGKLTKTGAGTLTLNNRNTYTGETTVSGGTLALGGTRTDALDTTGDLIVENNAIFALGQASQTFANVTLRAGQITRMPGAAAARGVLTVSNSGQIQAQSGAISANLAGAAPLIKTTDGRLTLSGDNRGYTGAVTVMAGVLRLLGGHALDDEAAVRLNNALANNTARLEIATSQTLGALTGRGQVFIGAGQTLTLNIGAGKSATYAGLISGAAPLTRTLFRGGRLVTETIRGGLTKTGAGRLTLTGANTFGGQTRINQGELRIEHLLALQNTAVHIEDAANTQLTVATKSLPWSRERITRIGSLSGGGRIVIFKDQVLAINQTTDGVYSGRIMEQDPVPLPEVYKKYSFLKPRPAVLIKTGAARLTLSGRNTYTGLTIIDQGTLAIGRDDAIHSASSLIVGQAPRYDSARARLTGPVPGVFDLGRHNQTLSGVELNAGAINRTGASGPDQGVLTVKSRSGFTLTLKSGTVNAILAGQTSLVKDNPFVRVRINRRWFPIYIESTVTLNAANTYSGQTRISRGTLRITNAGALGTANNDDATGTTIEPGRRRRLHTTRFGFTQHGGGTLELALGDGNHSIDNENLILAGRGAFDTKNHDITRETLARHVRGEFDARGALRNVSGNNLWRGAVRLAGAATIHNASGDPSAAAPSLTLSGPLTLTYKDNRNIDRAANLTVTGPGKTLLSGRIRGLGGLIKRGAGRLTLSGANLYTGLTTIAGGILAIAHNQALGGAGGLGTVVNTGGVLQLAGGLNVTDEALELAGGTLRNAGTSANTWGGAITLTKNSTIDGAGELTLSGTIDGARDLTLDGALIARFSGALGGTTALGNFTVNGARQIILTGALTLTGRATFRDITGVEETVGGTSTRVAIKTQKGDSPGSLTARELLLQDITGRVQLRGDVDTMAANNIGAFEFTDSDDLTVGTVGTVRGITTSNPLTLDMSGLLQSGPAGEAITTSSTLNLRARGIGAADTPLKLNFTGTAAGSLKVTTSGQGAAGNIYLSNAGDLKTSVLDLNTDKNTAQTVQLAARQSSGTPPGGAGPFLIVDDPDAGSSTLDANDTLIFNTAVKVNADRAITFRGALTFRGMIHAGTHRLTLTTPRLTLADDVTAGALNMGGAGELVIAGNSPTLHVNPVNLTFPNRMTGEGSLTIPGIQGQNLDVGRDLKLPTDMRDYRGHLIIGGRLTPEGILPWYHRDVTDIRVHVPRLTVSRAIETGGPVTLLGGDLDLNANIQTGGQLGLLATGPNQPGLAGSRGLIRAGGRIRLTVPPEGVPAGRPAAAFIAVGGFRNAFDINLRLGRRELDLASSQGAVGFDPRSRFTDQTTDPDFRAFVSRLGAVLGTNRSLNLQLAQAFAFNPASRLTGIEALAFIDLSLFGQELTLFGAIGTGIALSLSQCEEQYGCAPNVTLEELDTLIEQLTARIAELERRLLEADEAERATIEAQLAGYREELQNFKDYRETLRRYILAEEAADDLRALPEAGDADEVARLTRALQGVRARIQWLEGLRADAAERERLARATGQELTPARLEVIIEAAKAQATFIENRIRLLLEGTEAGLPEAPEFRAEAGDYESVDVAQYGQPLGALTLGGERGWY